MGRAAPLPVADDPLSQDALVYEANLHSGVTVIEVVIVAALPLPLMLANGYRGEVERVNIHAFLRPGGW
jgi:hypothetical protein